MKELAAALQRAWVPGRKVIAANVPDTLMVGGAALVSYGAWLIYPPAGFITGGALLLVAGILASRGAD